MTKRRDQMGEQPGPREEQVPHKGDRQAGGGGNAGGGGKRHRPDSGWEKGDRHREVKDHTDEELPKKPGSRLRR